MVFLQRKSHFLYFYSDPWLLKVNRMELSQWPVHVPDEEEVVEDSEDLAKEMAEEKIAMDLQEKEGKSQEKEVQEEKQVIPTHEILSPESEGVQQQRDVTEVVVSTAQVWPLFSPVILMVKE